MTKKHFIGEESLLSIKEEDVCPVKGRRHTSDMIMISSCMWGKVGRGGR